MIFRLLFSFSDAIFDIFKALDKSEYRVSIKHCFCWANLPFTTLEKYYKDSTPTTPTNSSLVARFCTDVDQSEVGDKLP